MSTVGYVLVAIVALGIAAALYATLAPRAKAQHVRAPEPTPLHGDDGWTSAAGEEFAGLNESARCDLVFAVGALDDERSQALLEHALGDPSEAVAVAAAHTLVGGGRGAVVEDFLSTHPGEHAARIAQVLELLGSGTGKETSWQAPR